ncbi:MAG TPA: DUF2922 family protein [Thermotogota bacterium]|nr:DUF2922 family protein [Thermotogota bacterium]HRW35412.1 DUF2922 family protein [Thermotogota bacterium]
MARTLNLIFTKSDGTGRKTIKVPEPAADIDTKTAIIQDYMANYAEGFVVDYPVFDEAHVIDTTSTELIDLVE